MNYKLAFISAMGEAARLWMCDARRGARSVVLNDYDATMKALLGEGWEPFGLAADGAVWFRKADTSRPRAEEGERPTVPRLSEQLPEPAL